MLTLEKGSKGWVIADQTTGAVWEEVHPVKRLAYGRLWVPHSPTLYRLANYKVSSVGSGYAYLVPVG